MNKEQILILLEEIKSEQHTSPFKEDKEIIGYIKQAEYNINYVSGAIIDYDVDLDARSLLKNYVLYADNKQLAEFRELYGGEYADLQAKYSEDSRL